VARPLLQRYSPRRVFHAGIEALGFPGNWIASAIEYHAVKAWLEQSEMRQH
jgi:hypothetical protein